MSEEFYIRTLENIKEYMQNSIDSGYHKFIYNDLGWDVKCVNVISAIDTFIDLYQKEKERNNDLNHELRIYKNETISKNKVREKIKEANKEIKQMEQDDIGIGYTLGNRWSDLKAKVKGWEELLQEGDK